MKKNDSLTERLEVTVIPSGEPWNENCYVIVDRALRESIIVDPGGSPDSICETAEMTKTTVKAIVLTHGHHDHVRAAANTGRHFSVPCFIHSADFPLLRKASSYSIAFGGLPFPSVRDPVALDVPGKLDFAPDLMRLLHTPGHTPGSCCFLFPGFAITGDTLLNQRVGRTDLPGCNRGALVASVDMLLESVAHTDVLYAGHRNPWYATEAREWWSTVRGNAPPLDVFEPETRSDPTTEGDSGP